MTPAKHLIDKNGNSVNYYGWQWWIHEHQGMVVYSMRGLKGQYVFIIPDRDVIIVRLGHKTSKDMTEVMMPSDIPSYIDIGLKLAGE